MTLYIAGINHFDPLARERVSSWLCSLSTRQSGFPSFVAVEFAEEHFRALRAQRAQYREWIRREWPHVPDSDLEHFERSLGYDGDSFEQCYSGPDVLWLDEGRDIDPAIINRHAWSRLQCLRFFERRNALMLPGVVSEQVQAHAQPGVFSPERSARFAERILARVRAGDWRWSVAIVGASHASDRFENSMRSLLVKAGMPCEVRLFCRLD